MLLFIRHENVFWESMDQTRTQRHRILSRSHGTKHSFCGSLPCTQKDLALVKKHCTLFNIWSLVKNSPGESHCRDQQGICYVLCILIFHKGGGGGGEIMPWTIEMVQEISLLFERTVKQLKLNFIGLLWCYLIIVQPFGTPSYVRIAMHIKV